jgi:hypothetical protein
MQAETPTYLWYLIPILFVVFFSAMWLGVTSLLGLMSGWFRLQRAFPDQEAQPAITQLRGVNGLIGRVIPVNFKYCLKLDVCPGGLRVSVTRLLGPFQRPFYVPWSSINIERGKMLFSSTYRLHLGSPVISTLTLYHTTAQKLAESGRLRLPDAQPGVASPG